VVTNADGVYGTGPLTAGHYRLEASLDGFETSVREVALAAGQTAAIDVTLSPARFSQSVVVTARRVEELAQDVPIPVSVVRGDLVSDAGAFNVNRLKEMIPTVPVLLDQPRNSGDHHPRSRRAIRPHQRRLEPGVGLYIDGVFHARPASATLDFLDVEQVEVLRGPQGTLFGKNTTAGAINVHHTQARLHAGSRRRGELRQPSVCPGKGIDHRPPGQSLAGRLVVLRHAA